MLSILALALCASAAPPPAPMQHGVVHYLPETPEQSPGQLRAIAADGYNMLILSSWVWTVPTEGSDLRRVAQVTLDWCDRNHMAVWLLHNIQWSSPGEGGDIEAALTDPTAAARRSLQPWAEVLRGHPCVAGVLLGNEVAPGGPELFGEHPRYLAAFQEWLTGKHGDISALNRRWKTSQDAFTRVRPPFRGGALHDVRRFNRAQFARFYDSIARDVLRPVLGDKLYGSKGGASPYILRQMPHYTVCSWDDLVANWPLWRTKLLVDTAGLPVFNSELHLYHDEFSFGPSRELSRYRYFTGALLGEWMTASFNWGAWSKPEIAAVHAATPTALADLRALEPVLRAFGREPPAFSILVTEATEDGIENHPRLEIAYAHAATTGLPWSFITDMDLDDLTAPTLLVDTPWLTQQAARRLAEIAATRQVVFVGDPPAVDEYGLPLAADPAQCAHTIADWLALPAVVPALRMPGPYTEIVDVPYVWWSPERGHFHFPVRYPRLEARQAVLDGVRYTAMVNHTREEVVAPAPDFSAQSSLADALTGRPEDCGALRFGPLEVKVLRAVQ